MAVISTGGPLRPLTILVTIAIYLLALVSASSSSPADDLLSRRQFFGSTGPGKFSGHLSDLLNNHLSPPTSPDPSTDRGASRGSGSPAPSPQPEDDNDRRGGPSGLARQYRCAPATQDLVLWINEEEDRAYTCTSVVGNSGHNYCISTSLPEMNSGRNTCERNSDCGAGAWCILAGQGNKTCWHVSTECDGLAGRGELKK